MACDALSGLGRFGFVVPGRCPGLVVRPLRGRLPISGFLGTVSVNTSVESVRRFPRRTESSRSWRTCVPWLPPNRPRPRSASFYSYSHKDEALRKKLETHLSLLKDQGIMPGLARPPHPGRHGVGRGDQPEPGTGRDHPAAGQCRLPGLAVLQGRRDRPGDGASRGGDGPGHPGHPPAGRLAFRPLRQIASPTQGRTIGDHVEEPRRGVHGYRPQYPRGGQAPHILPKVPRFRSYYLSKEASRVTGRDGTDSRPSSGAGPGARHAHEQYQDSLSGCQSLGHAAAKARQRNPRNHGQDSSVRTSRRPRSCLALGCTA